VLWFEVNSIVLSLVAISVLLAAVGLLAQRTSR